ncbi:response regulator [Polaromonas sp.]|uniref:response regulator n=1 Tax=Polaromonas sp. TaxID=1869339 RepID=UPI00356A431C
MTASAPNAIRSPEQRSNRLVRWAGASLLLVFIAIGGVQWFKLTYINAQLIDKGDNTLWAYFQLESEYLQVRDLLRDANRDPDHIQLDVLSERYEIFVSRLPLVQPGRTQGLLPTQPEHLQTLEKIQQLITAADPYLSANAGEPLRPDALQALLKQIEVLSEPIHALSLMSNELNANQISARNQTVREQNMVSIGLTVFQIFLTLSFAVLLLRQFRALGSSNRNLQAQKEELRQSTDQLRDSEATLSATINTALDAVVQMDSTGIITRWNTQAEEIFGWKREEAIGQMLYSTIIPPQYREAHIRGMTHFLATGVGPVLNRRVEIVAQHRDGHEFPIELSINPLKIANKHEFSSFIRNITERKQQQDEILRLNVSLEERVQALHSQQEELRQSNEELEEKNELLAEQRVEVEASKLKLEERAEQLALASKYKSEFLSSMSHELRTPLNSLLILAQLLTENAEHNMSGQQIEYAKTIQVAGKDLLALISDILDLSKIESGTVTLDRQDVSFANVGEQLERAFRHVARSRSLAFDVEIVPSLPPSLYTDSQRLQQVLKNLLSNAFKFTQKGQVSVRVTPVESGWSVDHDGLNRALTVLGFFVTDSGIGLPATKQKIIFEAFQQADTGTARKYGGTGLGLSISRELARLLGGELQLAMSSPGQGSTFVLYLPLRAPESGQDGRSMPRVAHGSGERLERDGESLAPKVTRPNPAAREAPQASMPQETTSGPPAALDDRTAIKPAERTPLIVEDDTRIGSSLAGKKVLVVDDDVRNIFALTALLERHEMAVIVAESGSSALEELGKNPGVAIVLMDIMMPAMDGYEAMRQIRQMQQFESLPIIALTANAMTGDREKCIAAGASGYVGKPVDTDQLLSLLRVWLCQ